MKQSLGEEGELWPFPPPGTGALTTSKTLFNLNPFINISNHTSPSSEGEKRKHTSGIGSLSYVWKEGMCVKGNRGKSGKDETHRT